MHCLNSLQENASCSYTYECLTPMTCTTNSICQCGAFQYYDNSTMTCKPQTFYNTLCQVTFNCRNDKGLTCQSGLCLCTSSTPTWSSTLNKCIRLLTYGEFSCTINSDCDSSQQLICSSWFNNCTCPIKSQSSMCDCRRTNGNEFYWFF